MDVYGSLDDRRQALGRRSLRAASGRLVELGGFEGCQVRQVTTYPSVVCGVGDLIPRTSQDLPPTWKSCCSMFKTGRTDLNAMRRQPLPLLLRVKEIPTAPRLASQSLTTILGTLMATGLGLDQHGAALVSSFTWHRQPLWTLADPNPCFGWYTMFR